MGLTKFITKNIIKESYYALTMSDTSAMTTVAPLLFLVVMKIADVAREIDLSEIHGKESWTIRTPWLTKMDSGNLGRFAYLHALNVVILEGTFLISAYTFQGNLIELIMTLSGNLELVLVSVVTLFVWLMLPLLEVDEYSGLTGKQSEIPESVGYHINLTTLTAISGLAVGWLYSRVSELPLYNTNPKTFALGLMVFITIFLVFKGISGYLVRLDSEMEK